MGWSTSILAALAILGPAAAFFILWKKKQNVVSTATSKNSLTINQQWHLQIDCSPKALMDDTLKKWSQHITKLPAAIDLPRLARKMIVFDESHNLLIDGEIWSSISKIPSIETATTTTTTTSSENNDEKTIIPQINTTPATQSSQALLREIMLILADQLNEHDVHEVVSNQMYEFIPDDYTGDISTMLQSFFVKKIDGSAVLRILKACNQSILAAAVVRLKAGIASRIPYKDYRGAWHIEISFSQDEICVIHKKREMSWEQHPQQSCKEDQFEFAWEFLLGFDRQVLDLRRVDLSITEVSFHEQINEKKKKEILEILKDYYRPEGNTKVNNPQEPPTEQH
jgi:hypothetical protein